MTRRLFLFASLMDPEKLLWVPGKKKIFIPSARVYTYSDLRLAEMYFQVHQKHGIYTPFIPMMTGDQWTSNGVSGSFHEASMEALQMYAPYVRSALKWSEAVKSVSLREGYDNWKVDLPNMALNASNPKGVQGPVPTSSEGLKTLLHVKQRTLNVDANRLNRAIDATKQGPCRCGVCLANNYLRNA